MIRVNQTKAERDELAKALRDPEVLAALKQAAEKFAKEFGATIVTVKKR